MVEVVTAQVPPNKVSPALGCIYPMARGCKPRRVVTDIVALNLATVSAAAVLVFCCFGVVVLSYATSADRIPQQALPIAVRA
jgi:hypothetical protein